MDVREGEIIRMKFKNMSKALFVGFNESKDLQFPGKPVRIPPGEVGEFSRRTPTVDLAVKVGMLAPWDKKTKELFEEK